MPKTSAFNWFDLCRYLFDNETGKQIRISKNKLSILRSKSTLRTKLGLTTQCADIMAQSEFEWPALGSIRDGLDWP